MKCEVKSCLNSAEYGSARCSAHGAVPPTVVTGVSEPLVVAMSEVPRSARFNERAAKLLKKVQALQSGSALRVEVKHYSIITMNTAKRYALDAGLRIGVRVCGELGYVWRLSEDEIKAVEQKAARLAGGRKRKNGKSGHVAKGGE